MHAFSSLFLAFSATASAANYEMTLGEITADTLRIDFATTAISSTTAPTD